MRLEGWCLCGENHLEHLDDSSGTEDLESGQPEEHLSHGALLDSGIVQLGKLDVARVHLLDTGELHHVLNDAAECGEHRHAAMLELGLAQPVVGEPAGNGKGVKANVAGPGACSTPSVSARQSRASGG